MKVERAIRSLTQEELAALCRLSKNQVGLIERCQVACTVDVIEQIAKGLQLEIADLFRERR